MKAYDETCCFCGLTFPEALEAAHIIPWQDCTATERLDVRNGLLLCATHHKLFDSYSLTINKNYCIEYFDALQKDPHAPADRAASVELHNKKINLPVDRALWPSLRFVEVHRAEAMSQWGAA